jgi:hypothetical protein
MSFQHKVANGRREQMIAEAAYFRAERRGFEGGDAVRDWCEAEVEIDALLERVDEEQRVARLEEVFEAASKKLAAVRRKASSVSAEARAEWQRDVDKLATLRDALKPQLAELREQGERAGHKLREQAERVRVEIADLVRRLEARAKH